MGIAGREGKNFIKNQLFFHRFSFKTHFSLDNKDVRKTCHAEFQLVMLNLIQHLHTKIPNQVRNDRCFLYSEVSHATQVVRNDRIELYLFTDLNKCK